MVKAPERESPRFNTPLGPQCDLAVVMPCRNEEESLGATLAEWIPALHSTCPQFNLWVIDDASTDLSPDIIESWAKTDPRVRYEGLPVNRGHGAACLTGYRLALQSGAPWILQIDSDGQCDPDYWPSLWEAKNSQDTAVVQGVRTRRDDGIHRLLASQILRFVVGRHMTQSPQSVTDPNCPWRLMRQDALAAALPHTPASIHLYNVALSVQLARMGWKHHYVPLRFRRRHGGTPSMKPLQLAQKLVDLNQDLAQMPPAPKTVKNPTHRDCSCKHSC